jgi:hypothetical protein
MKEHPGDGDISTACCSEMSGQLYVPACLVTCWRLHMCTCRYYTGRLAAYDEDFKVSEWR